MLSCREMYKRARNIYRNTKEGRVSVETAVDRLFDILSKSKNPHVAIYVNDWDDFVPIKTRSYFITKIKKSLPTLKQSEYDFDTQELHEDKEHAEKDAELAVSNAHKDLETLNQMDSRLAQHSAPSGRYEPASYRGLNVILYNLKNEIQNEEKDKGERNDK